MSGKSLTEVKDFLEVGVLATLVLAVMCQLGAFDTVAQFSSYIRAERWDFTVTRTMLEQQPAWVETDPSPPLQVRRAMAIASKQLGELVQDAERWRFNSVALHRVGGESGWVYVVEYGEPPPRSDGGISSHVRLVVLMSGTTVIPTRQPWPPR